MIPLFALRFASAVLIFTLVFVCCSGFASRAQSVSQDLTAQPPKPSPQKDLIFPLTETKDPRQVGALKLAWFTDREGIRNVEFSTAGFGAKRPKVSNKKPDGSDDPEGRQKNRRVEII